MEGGMFSFLDGASPWAWLALAVLLAAAELVVPSFALIWFGFGAAVVAAALALHPALDGGAQLAIFAVVSLGSVLLLRAPLMRRMKDKPSRPELNNRAARLVGREAAVVEGFGGGHGAVEVDGVRWKARLAPDEGAPGAAVAPPDAGAAVVVRGTEGSVLLVSPA